MTENRDAINSHSIGYVVMSSLKANDRCHQRITDKIFKNYFNRKIALHVNLQQTGIVCRFNQDADKQREQ